MRVKMEALSRRLLHSLGKKMVTLSKLPWRTVGSSESKTSQTRSPVTTTVGSVCILVGVYAAGTEWCIVCESCNETFVHKFKETQPARFEHVCGRFGAIT